MNTNITLANTKLVMDALKDEDAGAVQWAIANFNAEDVVAAKQLADEAGWYWSFWQILLYLNPGILLDFDPFFDDCSIPM
jgi:hypothetical protein